jgi:hypothetical protein
MSLLAEIDKLREEAAELAKVSNAGPLSRPAELREKIRADLCEKEARIDALLMKRIALADCPFCPGKLEPTPTKHVHICDHCRATALPGRMEVVDHGR